MLGGIAPEDSEQAVRSASRVESGCVLSAVCLDVPARMVTAKEGNALFVRDVYRRGSDDVVTEYW
jgi:hypothetical protein